MRFEDVRRKVKKSRIPTRRWHMNIGARAACDTENIMRLERIILRAGRSPDYNAAAGCHITTHRMPFVKNRQRVVWAKCVIAAAQH